MPEVALRILVVGEPSLHTRAILARLLQKGNGSHDAANLKDAAAILGTFQFDIVLAPESLPDGTGYELAGQVGAQTRSLLVSIQYSETCLWLPVVIRGRKVLGERALNIAALEGEIEEILTPQALEFRGNPTKEEAGEAPGRKFSTATAGARGRRRAVLGTE